MLRDRRSRRRQFLAHLECLEPRTLMAGAVAAYGFEEGAGAAVGDVSGSNLDGTISGATWTASGRFGSALSFDGIDDWVSIGDAAALDLTSGMTLEAWVNPSAIGAGLLRSILTKERAGGSVYGLYGNTVANVPSVSIVRASAPGTPEATSGVALLALNTWTHVAATYDGANLRLFVNGSQVATRALTGDLLTSTGALRIGGNSLFGEYFAGRIDEVRVYDRALNQAQIQADMNAPVVPPEPGATIAMPSEAAMTNPVFGSTFRSNLNGGTGFWDDAASWTAGRAPTATDNVIIEAGDTVVVRDTAAIAQSVGIYGGGKLRFATGVNTELRAITVLVLGELEMGTAADPVADAVTAKLTIRNVAINPAADPGEYGNGLVVLGKVTMHGTVKPSQIRLAAEPLAGQTTITLSEAATGWRVGDNLIFPDSKHWAIESYAYSPSYESATIAAISPDGRTITLSAALQFSHPGARNGDNVLEFLPHVANRTRNVQIKSESGSGTRGYTLFTGRADVDIRYATFQTLGRTRLGATGAGNVAERHPVTFNHLYGPQGGQANGYQYTFVGNSIFCGMPTHEIKWGLAINDSHYGLIQGNFLYNWQGAGLMAVSGNESFNVIERNIAIRGRGEGDREGSGNRGDEGSAFWFRGPNNYVRDNVGANYTNMNANGTSNGSEAAFGFKYNQVYLEDVRIPNFQGADTSVAGQFTVRNGNAMPILEFARNETYGTENALSIWWLNTINNSPQNGGESVIRDFRGWHISRYGLYGYPMNRVTFDGYVIRGDKSVLANSHESPLGMWFGDYLAHNIVVRRADIQGMRTGFVDPYFGGSTTIIEDSHFRNSTNINVRTLGAPGSSPPGAWRDPKSLVIRNVTHGSTAGWNLGGRTPSHIAFDYMTHDGSANLILPDTVFVDDYNGIAGEDYQLYYSQQAANFVVPQSSGNLVGSPSAGLTNQQNWSTHGIAIAGAVAPASAVTTSWTNGLVRTISGTPDTTPPTISAIGTSGITHNSATISWTTNEPADTQVEFGLTTSYGNSTTLNPALVTGHTVNLAGLSASSTYHFRVRSRDAAGNLGVSSDFTFATLAAPDTTPPVISNVTSSNITSVAALISWTTNEPSDTQVEYGTTTGYGSLTTLNTSMVTSHSANLTGLSANTTYHFRVKSRDAAGNLRTSNDFTFTTLAAPDTTPPVISNVTSSNITQTTALISWITNELADTQVEYGLTASYGSTTTLNTSLITSHSANLTGLTANTTYHFRVKSRDAAGNLQTSGDFTFTTTAIGVPTDWGTVDFATHDNLSFAGGETWYQLTSARAGLLTVEALFAHSAGNVDLALFNLGGQLLVSSNGTSNSERVEVTAPAAGTTYLVRVTGANADVDFRLANLVSQNGSTITVNGTAGNDTVQFTHAAQLWVTINGVAYSFAPASVSVINISGGQGADSFDAALGASGDDATFRAQSLDVVNSAYQIHATGVETNSAVGGGGTDEAWFYDSAGSDSLVARPTTVTLQGTGYRNTANAFEKTYSYADLGGMDVAELFDSAGNDYYKANSVNSALTGPGYFNWVKSFDEVYARATAGGHDRSDIYGTAGDELLHMSFNVRTFTGSGFKYVADRFERVNIYSGGGNDAVEFRDMRTGNTVYGRSHRATATVGNRLTWTHGFASVRAYAQNGQRPTADVHEVDYLFTRFGNWNLV